MKKLLQICVFASTGSGTGRSWHCPLDALMITLNSDILIPFNLECRLGKIVSLCLK